MTTKEVTLTQEWPFVSIIMPVRNEATFISQSLGSVLSQDYPDDRMEVVLADGMSTDATRAMALDLQTEHNRLYIVNNPGMIVSTGLNEAIRRARGEIIVRIDGHTIIAQDYVRTCVEALYRTSADNVGGKMTAVGTTRIGQAVALATSSPFGVGGARFHYSDREEWVDTVYMGAWRKDVFDQIGFFDEELIRDQDDEFNYRLREKGGRILLSPRIKSRYTVRGTLQSLWRQYYQYGYWKVRVFQKHPHQMRPRQFVPSALVVALVASALLAMAWPPAVSGLVGLICAYLLVSGVASARLAVESGWRHLALLPVVFGILHFSYGLGFLVGLIRFAGRWSFGDSPTRL